MKRNIKYILIQFFVIFLSIELILRISGIFKTYSEKIGNGYISYYGQILPTWYHRWTPSSKHCFNQPEFNYCYQYNSLGLRDREWINNPPDSIKRVIILGDSFTEGDGAPEKENFPTYLENMLNEKTVSWEVYNGGVCGNDPFYNLKFFNTIIVPNYEYDVLMLLVNNSDIADYIYRGGMERFHKDSTTHFRKAPWFESIIHYSHTARAILKYSKYIWPEESEKRIKAIHEIAEVYVEINREIQRRNKKMVVVIHTFPGTISRNEGESDEINKIESLLSTSDVPYINICANMQNEFSNFTYDKYAWKENGHFKSFGYKVFSDIIFEEANTKYPDLLK